MKTFGRVVYFCYIPQSIPLDSAAFRLDYDRRRIKSGYYHDSVFFLWFHDHSIFFKLLDNPANMMILVQFALMCLPLQLNSSPVENLFVCIWRYMIPDEEIDNHFVVVRRSCWTTSSVIFNLLSNFLPQFHFFFCLAIFLPPTARSFFHQVCWRLLMVNASSCWGRIAELWPDDTLFPATTSQSHKNCESEVFRWAFFCCRNILYFM